MTEAPTVAVVGWAAGSVHRQAIDAATEAVEGVGFAVEELTGVTERPPPSDTDCVVVVTSESVSMPLLRDDWPPAVVCPETRADVSAGPSSAVAPRDEPAWPQSVAAQARHAVLTGRIAEVRDRGGDGLENLGPYVADRLLVDDRGAVTYAGSDVARLLRTPPTELVDSPLEEYVHPCDEGVLAAALSVDGGDDSRSVYECRLRAGSEWRDCELRVRDCRDDPVLGGLVCAVSPPAEADRSSATEQKFRAVFEEAFDAMLITDDRGRYTDVNPAACELTGLSREELLGRTVADIAEDGFDFDDAWESFLESDHQRGLFPLQRSDGEVRTVEFAATTAVVPGRHLSVIRDVTERREIAAELRETNSTLASVIEASPLPIVALDDAGSVTMWNRAARETFGWRESEVLGDLPPTIPDGRRAAHLERLERLRDGETFTNVERKAVCKDGTELDVSISLAPLHDGDAFTGAIAVLADVTEEKRRERAIEQSEQRYRTLVEHLPGVFVALFDPELRYSFSRGVDLWTGTDSSSAFEGRRVEDVHESVVADFLASHYRKALAGRSGEFEVSVEERVYQVKTVPIRGESGDPFAGMALARDVTDRRAHEREMTALHDTARDLLTAETAAEIGQIVVDAASDILDLPCAVVYRYDSGSNELELLARDAEDRSLFEETRFGPGDGVVGSVFIDGETVVLEDAQRAGGLAGATTDVSSGLFVPLGDHGVLAAADTAVAAFDESVVERAEILAASAEAALDRASRERALRSHERRLKERNDQLTRVNQINEKIRRIDRALVESSTREQISHAVCEQLVELERFTFAWTGEFDPTTGELVPRARAGRDHGYLDAVTLTADESSHVEPAGQTAATLEKTVVGNVAEDPRRASWRREALTRDLRSVASVPLVHENTLYGVLTVYSSEPDAFDSMSRAVFDDLAETIAYAYQVVEQRASLMSGRRTTLDFRLAHPGDVFVDLASRLAGRVTVQSTTPRGEGTYLTYATVDDVDPKRVCEAAAATAGVVDCRVVADGDPAQFEFVVDGPLLWVRFVDRGARVASVAVDGETGETTVRATLPRQSDVAGFVDRLRTAYTDVELLAQLDSGAAEFRHPFDVVDRLTDRQREVLEAAFYGGFYEWPRESTGEEVASALGISQPAFLQNLRASERKLVTALLESSADTG